MTDTLHVRIFRTFPLYIHRLPPSMVCETFKSSDQPLREDRVRWGDRHSATIRRTLSRLPSECARNTSTPFFAVQGHSSQERALTSSCRITSRQAVASFLILNFAESSEAFRLAQSMRSIMSDKMVKMSIHTSRERLGDWCPWMRMRKYIEKQQSLRIQPLLMGLGRTGVRTRTDFQYESMSCWFSAPSELDVIQNEISVYAVGGLTESAPDLRTKLMSHACRDHLTQRTQNVR
ncbi:hypothetical protein BC629DRAFT_268550 [Irpex lacteus]|nr:hypothetical protein BC629DRAFT_268550 [Irpex lacteus]